MFQECRHIMPSGLHCKSPAMRGSAFCYFHARAQRPSRPGRPREARIEIPPVLDQKGIAMASNQVMQALASGHISSRRAAVLLYGMNIVSTLPPSGAASPDFSGLLSVLATAPPIPGRSLAGLIEEMVPEFPARRSNQPGSTNQRATSAPKWDTRNGKSSLKE